MLKNETPAMDVYYTVRKSITEQRMKPGMALTENLLCVELGVGRSSVRTALQRLEKEGFVELIPNRGAFVAKFSEKQVRDLFALRQLFLNYALEQSIDTYTDYDICYLEDCLTEQVEAFNVLDFSKYVAAISRFYSFIIGKSRNNYLVEAAEKVLNRISVYLCLYDNFYSVKKLKSLPFQKKMIEGICEGKVKKAIRAHEELCSRMIASYDLMLQFGSPK